MRLIKTLLASLLLLPGVRAEETSDIGDTIIQEIKDFITFAFDMLKQYIIEPPLRILKNMFSGVADSIYSVGIGMFRGSTGVMDAAWKQLADWLSFTGPFAPWIATAVIWGVIVITLFFALDIIADKYFPKPFEREIED